MQFTPQVAPKPPAKREYVSSLSSELIALNEYQRSLVQAGIKSNAANPKPRLYNGPVGAEYYCTSCATPIQLVNTTKAPTFCPYCATQSLVTDQERFRLDFSHSLHILPAVYDILLLEFRAQTAFVDFREYVNCMVKGAKPLTNKETIEKQKHYL